MFVVIAVAIAVGGAFLVLATPAIGLLYALLAAPFVASLAAGAVILVLDRMARARFDLDARIADLRALVARARREPASRTSTTREPTVRPRPRKRA